MALRGSPPLVGAMALTHLLAFEPSALAGEGTTLLLEAGVGASTPAYSDGAIGWAAGVAFGPTLRLRGQPVRWHLLGTVQVHHVIDPDPFLALSRVDLGFFVSQRTVFPIGHPLRLYLETGAGGRQAYRHPSAGGVVATVEPLIVLALGLQARFTQEFSLGARFALEPLEPVATPIDAGRDRPARGSALITLGAHF